MTLHKVRTRVRSAASSAAAAPSTPAPAEQASVAEPAAVENLEIKIVYCAVAQLHVSGRSARRHSKRKIEKLAASLKRYGCVLPILVDRSGTVIDGHALLEAARFLGWSKLPVVHIDHLSEAEVRSLRIGLNKLPELTDWDSEILAEELTFLCEVDLGLATVTGFEVAEIDAVLNVASEPDPDDEAPEPNETDEPVSRPGDLWTFEGGHRLLCGDSRDPNAYERLLAGDKAQMVFSDPPYNCKVRGHVSGRQKAREFVMASGEMSEADYTAFLTAVFRNLAAFSADGSIHFQCTDFRALFPMQQAGREAYSELKCLCTWDKQSGGMGSLYRHQAEHILVFKSGKAPHINNIVLGSHGRTRTTIWSYPGLARFGRGRDAQLDMHPSCKPVALVMDAILDCSKPGGVILDAFSGSGTTLVAAARTRRRGYALELDPRYVDVAVKRLEAVLKTPARHAESGLTFAEMAERRSVPKAGEELAGGRP